MTRRPRGIDPLQIATRDDLDLDQVIDAIVDTYRTADERSDL